jgi:hypothetical protein
MPKEDRRSEVYISKLGGSNSNKLSARRKRRVNRAMKIINK